MSRKRLRKPKALLSDKLRERARNCRRLALGAEDPTFTRTLDALAHEYETIAVEAERLAREPKLFRTGRSVNVFGYDVRSSAYKRRHRPS